MPPLEGGLVGDAAQLGRALDGDVVAHGPDEGDPDGERLPAVHEDGAREGGEPPAAAAAAPPRDAGGGGAVPPGSAAAGVPGISGPADRPRWIGNTYLDDSGRDSPASLNSTGDM